MIPKVPERLHGSEAVSFTGYLQLEQDYVLVDWILKKHAQGLSSVTRSGLVLALQEKYPTLWKIKAYQAVDRFLGLMEKAAFPVLKEWEGLGKIYLIDADYANALQGVREWQFVQVQSGANWFNKSTPEAA